AGGITLAGGTLEGAIVQQRITATTLGGTLNGVTLKGDAGQTQPTLMDIIGGARHVDVIGDLTLDNASINIQGGGGLALKSNVAALAGTGSVVFADNNANS